MKRHDREDPRQPSAADVELAVALLERPERWVAGDEAIRAAYPNAPDEMVATATHHLLVDGPLAAVQWLANTERFLRDPQVRPDLGPVIHLLYHAYNWLQFEALLPEGKAGLLELAQEVREFLDEGDLDAARASLGELEDALEGGRAAPDFVQP